MHFKVLVLTICILEGPEDDSVRVETCCPNKKVSKQLLCLTDTLYIPICVKHFVMVNIKFLKCYYCAAEPENDNTLLKIQLE